MTERELILKVINRLKTKGWTQKSFGSINGPNCLLGAIQCESHYYKYYQVHRTCKELLNSRLVTEGGSTDVDVVYAGINLTIWNDKPGRTRKEVISVLETLAEELLLSGY